jgi:hypothetical protein
VAGAGPPALGGPARDETGSARRRPPGPPPRARRRAARTPPLPRSRSAPERRPDRDRRPPAPGAAASPPCPRPGRRTWRRGVSGRRDERRDARNGASGELEHEEGAALREIDDPIDDLGIPRRGRARRHERGRIVAIERAEVALHCPAAPGQPRHPPGEDLGTLTPSAASTCRAQRLGVRARGLSRRLTAGPVGAGRRD